MGDRPWVPDSSCTQGPTPWDGRAIGGVCPRGLEPRSCGLRARSRPFGGSGRASRSPAYRGFQFGLSGSVRRVSTNWWDERMRPPDSSVTSLSSVDLPTLRGPSKSTTGSSEILFATMANVRRVRSGAPGPITRRGARTCDSDLPGRLRHVHRAVINDPSRIASRRRSAFSIRPSPPRWWRSQFCGVWSAIGTSAMLFGRGSYGPDQRRVVRRLPDRSALRGATSGVLVPSHWPSSDR